MTARCPGTSRMAKEDPAFVMLMVVLWIVMRTRTCEPAYVIWLGPHTVRNLLCQLTKNKKDLPEVPPYSLV